LPTELVRFKTLSSRATIAATARGVQRGIQACRPGERPGGQQIHPNAFADANPPSRPVMAKNCATVSSMICCADFTGSIRPADCPASAGAASVEIDVANSLQGIRRHLSGAGTGKNAVHGCPLLQG
jgi:hypothetical protein